MTEPLEPPDLDPADLAASAALDDEPVEPTDGPATTPDPARVASATAQFRQVGEAIRTGLPLPSDEVRDDHLARAVAAATSMAEPAPADHTRDEERSDEDAIAAVTPLTSRRSSTARRWLAVAAAVAVVALAVPILSSLRHRSSPSNQTASAVAATAESTTGAGADAQAFDANDSTTTSGAAVNPQVPGPSTTSTPSTASAAAAAVPTTPDLGTADTPVELATLVEAADPALAAGPGASTTTTAAPGTVAAAGASPATSSCDGAVRRHEPALGELVLATTATLHGTHLDVLVYADPATSGYRLVAVVPTDCTVVVDQAL